VFGFLGSLQWHKGPDLLIRSYRATILAGELQLHGASEAQDVYGGTLAAAARGDARIRFKGPFGAAGLPGVLAGLDVLVVPSRWHETYSLVAREALLAGVPVIASALGALPEVVRHGDNGLLVPPGDAQALTEALERAAAELARLKAGALASRPAPTVAEHVTELELRYGALAGRRAVGPAP
jgi:glycosyltransferase involved in cell wall biosynthesis